MSNLFKELTLTFYALNQDLLAVVLRVTLVKTMLLRHTLRNKRNSRMISISVAYAILS